MGALKISGIYTIVNNLNNKVYVGKSLDIYRRWSGHKSVFKKQSRNANRHLLSSVNKYGIENFRIEVLEEIPLDQGEKYFMERELFWMDYFNACDRQNGYNLRRDSSSKMVTHPDTKKLQSINSKGSNNSNYGNKWTVEQKEYMSQLKKEQYSSGTVKPNLEASKNGYINKLKNWEENPRLKLLMAKRVSDKKSRYNILKLDIDTQEVLETFPTFMVLKEQCPYIGKTVIFSVCNGWKKSYKGFLWRYQDKNTLEIVEPIKKF